MSSNVLNTVAIQDLRKTLDQLGIKTPRISSALAVRQKLRMVTAEEQQEVAKANAALASATTEAEFLKARENLAKVMTTGFVKSNPEFGAMVDNAVDNGVLQAFMNEVGEIEPKLCERYNETVHHHGLSVELTRDLPSLEDPHYANPLRWTDQQQLALKQWRDAAPVLNAVWNAYTQIHRLLGEQLSPSMEQSQNAMIGFALGDARNADHYRWLLDRLPSRLSALAQGSDQSNAYAPLAPHVFVPLVGVELRLKPMAEARALRKQLSGL
jgi:hypothetical protein